MRITQPFPLTGQAYELEMSFSLGETFIFSLLLVSSRQFSAWLSPQWLLSHSTPIGAISALCSAPSPPGRGGIFLLCIWPSVLSRGGCNWFPNCAITCGSPPKQYVVLTWRASRFIWLKTDQLQGSTGRRRLRFCVC
jgi:hypothetical protein